MAETWRSVVSFGGVFRGAYAVSDLGRVKSLTRTSIVCGRVRTIHRRILRTAPKGPARRPIVVLCAYGRKQSTCVHRLVLEAFVGLRPDGMEACHNDGDATNNRVENLRWDTRRNNLRDQYRHGTDPSGCRNGQSKLLPEEVRAIRLRWPSETQTALARVFGVSITAVHQIVHKRSYVRGIG